VLVGFKMRNVKLTLSLIFLQIVTLIFYPQYVHSEENYTEIPLYFSSRIPLVNVEIENSKIPFMLDTGAAQESIVINESLSKKLKIYKTRETKKSVDFFGNTQEGKEFIISSIRLGDFVLHNIKGTIRQPWGLKKNQKAPPALAFGNGIIGLKLLKKFKIIIDYPHKNLVLIKNKIPPRYTLKNWNVLFFDPQCGDGIVTQAYIQHSLITLLWDTGANFMPLHPRHDIRGRIHSCPSYVEKSLDDTICKMLKVSNLKIGKKEYNNIDFILVSFQEPKVDGFIGEPFLAKHIIYIDFKKGLLAISE